MQRSCVHLAKSLSAHTPSLRNRTVTMAADIVEGVFAINKPPSITSAQVIRDVQSHFKDSKLFKPWLENEAERLRDARSHQRKWKSRKSRQPLEVKMGHGGTLDPMATGVLILGVGAGTKKLSDFLACTKSYDAVVLFGQATDTYDVVGKTVARKKYDHITKEQVESALAKFRGDIMQRPPIYSALRVQGKRLYEYAREGKDLPVEIKERPVKVEELEMVEWFEGGTHNHHWPTAEAETEEKLVVTKVLDIEGETNEATESRPELKRQRDDDDDALGDPALSGKRTKSSEGYIQATATSHGKAHVQTAQVDELPQPATVEKLPCPAPACRLRMTVTSGFYVRSLCHDLGAAVGSLGAMASLTRTRQGQYVLGENVFEYADLQKGEDVWSPAVQKLLEDNPE